MTDVNLMIKRFSKSINSLINNSGLPVTIIESILKNVMYEVRELSKKVCDEAEEKELQENAIESKE